MKRSTGDSSYKNEAVLALEEAIECTESTIKVMQKNLEVLRVKRQKIAKLISPEKEISDEESSDDVGFLVSTHLKRELGNGKSCISILQESLVNNGLRSPVYEDNGFTGPPHIPIYLYSCRTRIGSMDLTTSGESGSKKAAKEIAASETIDHIITIYR